VTGSAVDDGGVCIDLRPIDHVVVDPEARTARVGGGAARGAVDAACQARTRRPGRDAALSGFMAKGVLCNYLPMWPPDPSQDQLNIDKTRQIASALKPWTTGQVYLNFIGDEGLTRVESAYGPEKYARLRKIKKVWDPDNVFRHNQNIPPAG
jgi:FAD/FMN-containing dehydrogenase